MAVAGKCTGCSDLYAHKELRHAEDHQIVHAHWYDVRFCDKDPEDWFRAENQKQCAEDSPDQHDSHGMRIAFADTAAVSGTVILRNKRIDSSSKTISTSAKRR